MKEKYEAPNLRVVHVNVKNIVAVSQIGEGEQNENPEVKAVDSGSRRNLWNEEW